MATALSLRATNRGNEKTTSEADSSGPILGFDEMGAGRLWPRKISSRPSRRSRHPRNLSDWAEQELLHPARVIKFQDAHLKSGCSLLGRFWIKRYPDGGWVPI